MVQTKHRLTLKPYLGLWLFLFLVHSLSSQPFESGTIIDTVRCESDPAQTYALYIPSSIGSNAPKSVIYFMEPAARGSLPLKLYRQLAEKYEIVLIGSNNSKNGPLHLGVEAYENVRKHTQRHLQISDAKVVVSGFSGGGRLSQHLASLDSDIDGVISVAGPKSEYSAHFPGENDDLKYAAVVGTRDMNYREHRLWDETLKERKVESFLNVYDAGHQWAPEEEYEVTIAHLYGLLGLGWNTEYIERVKQRIDSLKVSNLSESYRLATSFENKTLPISNDLTEIISGLEAEKGFKKAMNQDGKYLKDEGRKMELYYKAFSEFETSILNPHILDSTTYTASWWRKEIKALINTAKKADSRGDMSARLLDNLNGYLHGVTNKGDQMKRYDLSLQSTELQLLISQNAPWFQWKKAIYLANLGEEQKAKSTVSQLRKNNPERLKEILQLPYWDGAKARFPYLFI